MNSKAWEGRKLLGGMRALRDLASTRLLRLQGEYPGPDTYIEKVSEDSRLACLADSWALHKQEMKAKAEF